MTTQGQLSAEVQLSAQDMVYMWCLYADFKFWFRSSEGTVLSSSTYATSLIKESYASRSIHGDGEKTLSDEMVEAIRDTLDCNPVFHGNVVGVKSDDRYYDGKYSCIRNYLLFCYIAARW